MSDSFAQLMDGTDGGRSPSAGQGLESSFTHSWLLPHWVPFLIAAAAAAYVIATYIRERGEAGRLLKTVLAGLRVSVVGLVIFLMYGWLRHQHRTELPELVVLLDVSQSMSVPDQYEDESVRERLQQRVGAANLSGLTRLNLAKSLLLDGDSGWLERLRRRYQVKVYQIGSSARLLAGPDDDLVATITGVEAGDDSSRLGTCLRDILDWQTGRPTAAAVILSDGVTTAGKSLSESADLARRRQMPFYTVGIGNDRSPRDLRLSGLVVDDVVFLNDLVSFDFKLSASGYAGQAVTVRLRSQPNNSVLAETRCTIQADRESQAVSLSFRPPTEGEFEHVIEVEPLPGEVDANNNRLTHRITVRDQSIRVLLVQDYPSFEWRFLKMLLGRVVERGETNARRTFELTSVLHDADEDYAGQDETAQWVFPVSRDELFRYDVVIYGDVDPARMNQTVMENIAAFVAERGGGIVFLAGPRHLPAAYRETPLASLIPVAMDTVRLPDPQVVLDETFEFQAQPTPLGLATPHLQLAETPDLNEQVWQEFPPLRWLVETPALQPAARALVVHPTRVGPTGENLPVVVLQQVGAGRVVFHATDESYRWSRHPGGERYYARYWMQTLRYLARAKLLGPESRVELSTERDEYPRGEPVRMGVRFLDERLAPGNEVAVVLEHQAGRRRQVALTRDAGNRAIFTAAVDNLPEGVYRMWLTAPALDRVPSPKQFSVVAPAGETDRLIMNATDLRAAAEATGGRFYTYDTAGELLSDLPSGRQVRIESLPPEPAWNSWLAPALFVALLATEWLLRKRAALP